MTILNDNSNTTKKIIISNVSAIYKTKDAEHIEHVGDYILLGGFNSNVILKSIKFSSLQSIVMQCGLVLLNSKKEEIKYKDASDVEHTLTPLVPDGGLNFSSVLTNVEKLDNSFKFKTLEEHIINETGEKIYRDEVFLALKVTTAPTTAVAGLPILVETDFIEKY